MSTAGSGEAAVVRGQLAGIGEAGGGGGNGCGCSGQESGCGLSQGGRESPVLALQVVLPGPVPLSQGQEGAQAVTATSEAPKRARLHC